jgi:hypothetical protein
MPNTFTIPTVPSRTPREFGRDYRIGIQKVLRFIANGELRAVNVAPSGSVKPQWIITPEAASEFERRRSSVPTPKPAKQRRQPVAVDFFPGD